MSELFTYGKSGVFKNRSTWMMFVWRTDEEGNRVKVTKSSGVKCVPGLRANGKPDNTGRREALQRLDAWRLLLLRGEGATDAPTSKKGVPFVEYAQRVLDEADVVANTKDGYRAAMRRIAESSFAEKPIDLVTGTDIREWVDSLQQDGLSPVTIRHYHGFCSQVFNQAVARGDVAVSPIRPRTVPQAEQKPVNSLDEAGYAYVLDMSERLTDGAFAIAIQLALLAGMRRGEICALRWCDVNLDRRTLRVTHSLTKDHGYVLAKPKGRRNVNTVRAVPFGSRLEGYLRARMKEQERECAESNIPFTSEVFVAGNALTKAFLSPTVLTRTWGALVQATGLKGIIPEQKLRLHDLRHSYATIALANGMNIMTLYRILGHKSPDITLAVYSAALPVAGRLEVDAVDALYPTGAGRGRHFAPAAV